MQSSPQLPTESILLTGPTGVGKSEAALLLAERIGGEIVSVDSMQVYRGLNIGTAKPTTEEQRRVPHHLIDIIDLTQSFDAAQFAELARRAVEQIRTRGRVPILCGGTGLYFKAFLEGLGEARPADPVLRSEVAATPISELIRELEARDPVSYREMDLKNSRRVMRAIEVIRLTGKPFSELRANWKMDTHSPGRFFGLHRSPADLHRRIEARVDRMFSLGLIEETKGLLSQGLRENKTALQAIGYRQVVEHLNGERSLPETIELVKVRTRQFAKRQRTWFRHQARVEWIPVEAKQDSEETVDDLLRRLREQGLSDGTGSI